MNDLGPSLVPEEDEMAGQGVACIDDEIAGQGVAGVARQGARGDACEAGGGGQQ